MKQQKILITGGTGFLGQQIVKGLRARGCRIYSLGRTTDNDIVDDLAYEPPSIQMHFDIVVHAAGRAHMIPETEKEKELFYKVNVQGTRNLLDGLEKSSIPLAFIFISTVAVYGKESGEMIKETEPMLAKDPYGLSKIQAENIITEWCEHNNVVCTIYRLPLIAGSNPPGNLKSMINSIEKGYYFNVGGGYVRKSIVMAEDIAEIIFRAPLIGGIYNLTDGFHPSVCEIANHIALQLHKKSPKNIPFLLAKIMAIIGDFFGMGIPINSLKLKKLSSNLTFDDTKARKFLGWNPTSILSSFKIK
jgi:nucleoside-diphosphate-sugar epimerase